MIKKYILAVVAIVLAVWIGFFMSKESAVAPDAPINNIITEAPVLPVAAPVVKTASTPKKESLPTMTKEGSVIVYYTNSGFNPATVTIKAGKSVRFVNNSDKAMSITTTSLDDSAQSELNQSKTVGRGGVYDFTFMRAGTWEYKNRNNQGDKGTIIVQ